MNLINTRNPGLAITAMHHAASLSICRSCDVAYGFSLLVVVMLQVLMVPLVLVVLLVLVILLVLVVLLVLGSGGSPGPSGSASPGGSDGSTGIIIVVDSIA